MASATSSAFRAGAASRRARVHRPRRRADPLRGVDRRLRSALRGLVQRLGQRPPSNFSRERVRVEAADAGHAVRGRRVFSKSAEGRADAVADGRREPLDGRAHQRLQAVVAEQTARDVRLRRQRLVRPR